MKFLTALVSALIIAVATMLVTFAVGLRTKSPPVLKVIRRMNRAVVNPRQVDAGGPGPYASVIRHTGRTTGTPYATPVGVVATDEGFAIALPYGAEADWLKNVLASGAATIVHEGQTHRVTDPTVVPIETATAYFSPREQRAHHLFGTDECLTLRLAGSEALAEPLAPTS
jgi:deazaflavin-dependent oxidoreductase (nitroreductase family)